MGVTDAIGTVLLVTKGLDIGGVERIVVDQAVGLRSRGVSVEVALVNGARDRMVAPLEDAGVPVRRLGGSDLIGARAARRLAVLARGPRFEVVHVHGPLPSVVARAARSRSAALVTTSHTPFSSLHPATRAAWQLTASRDDAVIAVSAAVAASLPRHQERRAVVIPHGVDQDRVEAARRRGHDSRGSGDGAVRLVTVASHREAKNYPNLLQAVRQVVDRGADVKLLAVGEGPRLDDHRQLATELGLGGIVEFAAPTVDVLDVMAGADLVVVASDFEGQPLVVLEALALGRPVVATAVGRVPELVSPAVGRVVPPRDPVALGSAIVELASDPELRRRLGLAAERLPRWSLDDVVDAHLALYGELRSRRCGQKPLGHGLS